MTDTHNQAPPPRLCWACQSEIKPKQIKCLECESWQNWRRALNLSNTTISLLIALVSVSTVFGSAYRNFFEKKIEQIQVIGEYVDDSTITLKMRNIGNSPVIVGSRIDCSINFNRKNISPGDDQLFLSYFAVSNDINYLDNEKNISMKFTFPDADFIKNIRFPSPVEKNEGRCTLDFSGDQRTLDAGFGNTADISFYQDGRIRGDSGLVGHHARRTPMGDQW